MKYIGSAGADITRYSRLEPAPHRFLAAIAVLALASLAPGVTMTAAAQGHLTAASVGFGSYSSQTDLPANTLTCGVGVNNSLGQNHTDTISTAAYQLKLSVDANFGAIGTGLTLIDPATKAAINTIQAISGAGAAWQTSYFVYDTTNDRLTVFNQAAGNDVSFQWGYANPVTNLTATTWNPLWSDHYHPTYSKTGFATQIGTSPCSGTGTHIHDGRGAINATPIETAYGTVTHITNAYQMKALGNQSWGFIGVDQSLYLSGVIAAQTNLRLLVVGKSGWVDGPVHPAGKFSLTHATGSCTSLGCTYQTGSDVAYLLLNYTVGTASYAIAILEPSSTSVIIQTLKPYCGWADDPAKCGAVQIHSFLTSSNPVKFTKGEIRTYQLEYYIGTATQLTALGFDAIEGTSVSNYKSGAGKTCAQNATASSNNELPAKPANNLLLGTDFYSSNPFSGATNINGTFAGVSATSRGMGHMQLTPRLLAGTVYSFPNLYRLSTYAPDSGAKIDLGVFNTQPDNSGIVDIPLGYQIDANVAVITPIQLGQDNYANYYLQLANLRLCN